MFNNAGVSGVVRDRLDHRGSRPTQKPRSRFPAGKFFLKILPNILLRVLHTKNIHRVPVIAMPSGDSKMHQDSHIGPEKSEQTPQADR